MKTSVKIAALFFAAVVIVFVLLILKEASKPMSEIIAGERDKLARSLDKDRARKDANYAREMEDKLRFLSHRLALAYTAEDKADAAIAVLNNMIRDEEAKAPAGSPRRSRSYFDEAKYYDTLIGAYQLKRDDAKAIEAARIHDALLARASELKRQEEQGEGRSVGLNAL